MSVKTNETTNVTILQKTKLIYIKILKQHRNNRKKWIK